MRAELPAQLVELVDTFRNPLIQIEFLNLLYQADILNHRLVCRARSVRVGGPLAAAAGHATERAGFAKPHAPSPWLPPRPTLRLYPPSTSPLRFSQARHPG